MSRASSGTPTANSSARPVVGGGISRGMIRARRQPAAGQRKKQRRAHHRGQSGPSHHTLMICPSPLLPSRSQGPTKSSTVLFDRHLGDGSGALFVELFQCRQDPHRSSPRRCRTPSEDRGTLRGYSPGSGTGSCPIRPAPEPERDRPRCRSAPNPRSLGPWSVSNGVALPYGAGWFFSAPRGLSQGSPTVDDHGTLRSTIPPASRRPYGVPGSGGADPMAE